MEKRITEIVENVATESEVALYDFELKRTAKGLIIAIFLTKVGGVTITECKTVSKKIANTLEEEDFIEERYFLEVSSPGLERFLKLKKHYVSAINEKIKLTFDDGEQNISKIGILKEVLPDEIKMEVDAEIIEIPFLKIKKAKTQFDFKDDIKKNNLKKKKGE